MVNNNLSLSFTSVKVTQPISKKATLPVKVAFSNLPSGMSADDIDYRVDHSTITVIGTPDVISGLSEVTLSPIDLTQISPSSDKFEVSAALNDGVRIFDSIETFTVTVDVSDYAESVFTISNIKCVGLSSEFKVKSDGTVKNVKICGPKSVISELTVSDLYAVADLTDKSAGSHTVPVIIRSDKYDNIWQFGSYSISVDIS